MHAKFGEPHSLQRSIEFGIMAGLLAGLLAAIFGVSLPLVVALAAGCAGWLVGYSPNERRNQRSAVSRGARNIPMFAILAAVIAFVSLASQCGGIGVPTPGMQQQSGH